MCLPPHQRGFIFQLWAIFEIDECSQQRLKGDAAWFFYAVGRELNFVSHSVRHLIQWTYPWSYPPPLAADNSQQLTRCPPGGRLHPRAQDDGLLRRRPLPPQISPWRCQGPLPLLGLPGEVCEDRRAEAAPLPDAPRQDWTQSESAPWKDQVWGGGIKRAAAGFLKWYVMACASLLTSDAETEIYF